MLTPFQGRVQSPLWVEHLQYSRLKGGVAFTCIVFSQQDNCWLTLVCQYSRLKGGVAFTRIIFSQQDNCWLTLVCQYSRLKGGMAFTCIVFSQQDNCWLTLVCQYSRLKGVWPLPVSYFHSRITVDWLLFVNIQGWKGGVAFTCIIFSQQDNCWLTLVCQYSRLKGVWPLPVSYFHSRITVDWLLFVTLCKVS